MPQECSHPGDSFGKCDPNAAEKRIEVRDSRLSGVVNPAIGEHRIHREQFDTHTWCPGSSGERRSGHGHMAGPTESETAARVPSKLA